MGRDQVKRNQAARGRGRCGAGGRGGGGGGGAGGKTNSRSGTGKSSSSSALSLGDNSHRYDHRSSRSCIDVGVDEHENDDDDGRMEAFDAAFAHYDASPSSLTRHDDDSLDFFADSAPTTHNNTDRNVGNDDETRARNSWMEIDIKALDKCLRQHIPLHDRLHVPIHIASHVEERYGVTSNRKKTLAELREESKCIVVQHDDDGCASSSIIETISECSNHDEFTNIVQVDGGINEKDEADKDDDNDDDDDDDEDLEAWLDDVIS